MLGWLRGEGRASPALPGFFVVLRSQVLCSLDRPIGRCAPNSRRLSRAASAADAWPAQAPAGQAQQMTSPCSGGWAASSAVCHRTRVHPAPPPASSGAVQQFARADCPTAPSARPAETRGGGAEGRENRARSATSPVTAPYHTHHTLTTPQQHRRGLLPPSSPASPLSIPLLAVAARRSRRRGAHGPWRTSTPPPLPSTLRSIDHSQHSHRLALAPSALPTHPDASPSTLPSTLPLILTLLPYSTPPLDSFNPPRFSALHSTPLCDHGRAIATPATVDVLFPLSLPLLPLSPTAATPETMTPHTR